MDPGDMPLSRHQGTFTNARPGEGTSPVDLKILGFDHPDESISLVHRDRVREDLALRIVVLVTLSADPSCQPAVPSARVRSVALTTTRCSKSKDAEFMFQG